MAVKVTYCGLSATSVNLAHLYYTDRHRSWTDGAKVEITPKVQVAAKN